MPAASGPESPRGQRQLSKRRTVVARVVAGEKSEVSGVTVAGRTVHISDPDFGKHDIEVDDALREGAGQEGVYKAAVAPLLESTVASGVNTSCLLYGSSLTGKTGLAFGRSRASATFFERDDSLVARAIRSALNSAERLQDAMGSELSFELSVVEVHGDKVHDLLAATASVAQAAPQPSEANQRPETAGSKAESVLSMEGSVASMPSLMSGIAQDHEVTASEQEVAGYQRSVIDIELKDRIFQVGELMTKQITSEVDALALVQSAIDFRNLCSPVDMEGAHVAVTLYCNRRDKNSASAVPTRSCMHLVNLAATESFNGRVVNKKHAASVELDLKSLSKVLSGGTGVWAAVNNCALTRFLSPALTGTACTCLVANVLSTPAAVSAAVETMGYAKKCMAVELRTPVSAGANPEYVVVDHAGVVDDLKRQIAHLHVELKTQHSHYTQLLHKHAPHALPRGPLEHEGASDYDSEALDSEEEEETPREESVRPGAAVSAMSTTMSTVKSAKTMRGASTARATQRANEAKIRELEEHLERQKYRNDTLENQVGQLREQLIEVKEKGMQNDHLHYKQSKKLTEQVKLTKEHAKALEEQMQFESARDREAAQAVEASLKDQNDSLRQDFNTLMGSIPRFMEKRTEEVADEREMRSTIKSKAQEELKAMVSAAEANAMRQVGNLKSQSEFLLQRKDREIKTLKDQHTEYINQACAREASLTQELDYLYEYANRLARIIERVEAGKYSIRSLKGTKTYQIPGHEKPVPLNMDRLLYITTKLRQTEKFETLEGTEPPPEDGNYEDGDKPAPDEQAGSDSAPPVANQRPSLEDLGEVYKDQLRAQVMDELSQDEAVQYIRGLELDVRRYRTELQLERKNNNSLRIALSSAQRTPAPQPSPPFDKSNRESARRSMSVTSSLPYPEKWGNPLGASVSSNITGARPGTAPEHLRSLRRPEGSPRAFDPASGYRPSSTGRATFGYRNSMNSSPPVSPLNRSASLRRSG